MSRVSVAPTALGVSEHELFSLLVRTGVTCLAIDCHHLAAKDNKDGE